MLTDDQKSEVRRHLRYPAASRGHLKYPFGQTELFRFNQESNFLEQRLDLLVPLDEAKLTGGIIGVIAMVGPEPEAGSSFTISITSSVLTSPVVVGPIAYEDGDDQKQMGLKLSKAIVMNATLAGAGISAGGPYGPGFSNQEIPLPQVIITAKAPFTIAFTDITNIGVMIQQQGTHVEPHWDSSGMGGCDSFGNSSASSSAIYGYLPILARLEALILGSSSRASTVKAGDWIKGDELGEREKLYNKYVQKMATFLGVDVFNDGSSGGCSFIL